jgi:hypothetical protein
MNKPPQFLDGAKVLRYCILDEGVSPTGSHTIHIGDELFTPSAAAVCQYAGNSKFYVFYCDGEWDVVTDMDYDSLNEAVSWIEHGYRGAAANMQTSK